MSYSELPRYNVTEIVPEAEFFPATDLGVAQTHGQTQADLMAANAAINTELSLMREAANAAYLVEWRGSMREPLGAVVGNHIIGRTQRGFVKFQGPGGASIDIIGTYARIHDQVGEEPKLNLMAIFLNS